MTAFHRGEESLSATIFPFGSSGPSALACGKTLLLLSVVGTDPGRSKSQSPSALVVLGGLADELDLALGKVSTSRSSATVSCAALSRGGALLGANGGAFSKDVPLGRGESSGDGMSTPIGVGKYPPG